MQLLTNKRRLTYTTFAGVLFTVHFLLVLLVVFGWLVPPLFYVFLGALIATIISEIFFGYCFLSKWEFGLRKKLDPSREFDKSCIIHYIRMVFGMKPRKTSLKPRTFASKYSFIFILILLLTVSIFYRVLF